jgi:hypothetical protein
MPRQIISRKPGWDLPPERYTALHNLDKMMQDTKPESDQPGKKSGKKIAVHDMDFELPDNYKDKLVKLIPAEIVAAYITIHGLVINSAENNKDTLLWIVFGFLVFLTPAYLHKLMKVTAWKQIIFTTIAFVIWVTAIGGPFQFIFGFDAKFLGSIMLILYTLLIPLVYA